METKEPQQRRGDAGVASLVLSIISLLAFIVFVVLANSLNWDSGLDESPAPPFVFIGVLALVSAILGIIGLIKFRRPGVAAMGLALSIAVLGVVAFVGSFAEILYWLSELTK